MSTIKVDNIQATGETVSRGVSGVAAAWANWGASGSTTVRESQNVSSLTDLDVGTFTLNMSNAFTNNAFSNSGICGVGAASGNYYIMTLFGAAPTASSVSVRTAQSGSIVPAADLTWNGISLHGDLA